MHGHRLLSVNGQQRLIRYSLDPYCERGVAPDHNRPQGQQMRADGRDHHRIHVRGEDGTVGSQCICGGTSGGRNDNAVGAEAGNLLALQFHREFAHAGDIALGDYDFIERPECRLLCAIAPQLRVQHDPRIQDVAIVAPAIQGGIEVGEANLGQEAQIAQINAQYRSACGGKDARNRQQSTVPTQNNHQLRRPGGHFSAVHGGRGLCIVAALQVKERFEAALAQPADQLRQEPDQLFFQRLANYADAHHAVSV